MRFAHPLVLPAALILSGASQVEATCGSTACFLSTRTQDGALGKKTFRFDLSYRYVDQSRHRSGSSSTDEVLTPGIDFAEKVIEPGHHREIRTAFEVLQADLSYGVTDRLTLLARAPLFASRHHEHVVIEEGEEERFTDKDGTSGFGDVQLGARYAWLPSSLDLILVTGEVKLPTGAHERLDTAGEITEPSLQPGTGSTDLIGSVLYSHQIGDPGSEIFGTASLRHNGTSDLEYQLGDETQVGIGASRSVGGRWTGTAQVNLRHAARDRFLEGDVPSTGSTLVNVTPGLRYSVTPSLALYGFVPVPLYQRVNEAQLAPKVAIVVGLSGRF